MILIDMFRALGKSGLPKSDVFSVTVGASSKKTAATWHLLEPKDVLAAIVSLIAGEEEEQMSQRPKTA